ncbi:MAG: PAS domain-containing protein [Spirochaetales bacterium]|nr:PAS domain-containing protein [Spirochaetales bacterium]
MDSDKNIYFKQMSVLSESKLNKKVIMFLLESSPMGVALINPKGQYISVNRNFAQKLGYNIGEVEGIHYSAITCPLFSSEDEYNYQKMINGEIDSCHINKQHFNSNGEASDVRVDVFSYNAEETDSMEFVGFYQNCRPFYKKYLPLVHPELLSMADSNEVQSFLICREDGRIMFGGQAAANLLGYSERDIGNQSLRTVLDPKQTERLLYALKRIAPGKFLECKLTFCHREHSYINIRVQVFPDNTNWFKTGRLLLIVFKNDPETDTRLQHELHEVFGKDIFLELRKINDSIKSLSKNDEGDGAIKSEIKLSDYGLTGRERDVLSLLLERKNTKEIAYDLGLAEITIRKHFTSLYRKFEVSGREDLLLLLYGKNIA